MAHILAPVSIKAYTGVCGVSGEWTMSGNTGLWAFTPVYASRSHSFEPWVWVVKTLFPVEGVCVLVVGICGA